MAVPAKEMSTWTNIWPTQPQASEPRAEQTDSIVDRYKNTCCAEFGRRRKSFAPSEGFRLVPPLPDSSRASLPFNAGAVLKPEDVPISGGEKIMLVEVTMVRGVGAGIGPYFTFGVSVDEA